MTPATLERPQGLALPGPEFSLVTPLVPFYPFDHLSDVPESGACDRDKDRQGQQARARPDLLSVQVQRALQRRVTSKVLHLAKIALALALTASPKRSLQLQLIAAHHTPIVCPFSVLSAPVLPHRRPLQGPQRPSDQHQSSTRMFRVPPHVRSAAGREGPQVAPPR